MIKQFKHKGLKKFFIKDDQSGINPQHAATLGDILDRLDAAIEIKDMHFPGSNLHLLNPKKDGIYAVSVSGAWRITFKIVDGNVYAVDYKQYH